MIGAYLFWFAIIVVALFCYRLDQLRRRDGGTDKRGKEWDGWMP